MKICVPRIVQDTWSLNIKRHSHCLVTRDFFPLQFTHLRNRKFDFRGVNDKILRTSSRFSFSFYRVLLLLIQLLQRKVKIHGFHLQDSIYTYMEVFNFHIHVSNYWLSIPYPNLCISSFLYLIRWWTVPLTCSSQNLGCHPLVCFFTHTPHI